MTTSEETRTSSNTDQHSTVPGQTPGDQNDGDNSQSGNNGSSSPQQLQQQQQPQQELHVTSMRYITALLVVLALPHFILGGICAATGVVLFGRKPIWFAFSVAPIWSGGFVVVCGGFGIASAKSKTVYAILCFSAASLVSLVTCTIGIQLLRMGLVNNTTDGQTFLKDSMDTLVMVALSTSAVACAFSVLSAIVSGLIAWQLKKEEKIRGRRRVLSKEEIIAERQKQLKQQKEQEKKVLDRIEKERTRAGRYHRI